MGFLNIYWNYPRTWLMRCSRMPKHHRPSSPSIILNLHARIRLRQEPSIWAPAWDQCDLWLLIIFCFCKTYMKLTGITEILTATINKLWYSCVTYRYNDRQINFFSLPLISTDQSKFSEQFSRTFSWDNLVPVYPYRRDLGPMDRVGDSKWPLWKQTWQGQQR